MPMVGLLRPITALLLSAAIMLMGNGLAGVLIPVRADLEGFTRLEIGLMGSSYFAGLLIGCFLWPGVIGRVGHIRAFTALTALSTVVPLAQAVWAMPTMWFGLRFVHGLVAAGLSMVIESWLTGTATPETRGRVLASYTMINLTVITLGQQLLALDEPKDFRLFTLIAVLYSLAAVPVALANTTAPVAPRRAKLRLVWLFAVSPAAVLGCLFTGLANSGFWTLAPIYARASGLSTGDVALFMTCGVLGGAASQWPAGQLSDRIGRRRMAAISALGAAALGVGLFAAAAGRLDRLVLLALAVGYGACAFPIYTLCVAHANDLVHRKRAVEVSSGLLLTFSAGAIVGPFIASLAMRGLDQHGALFLYSAVAHGLIALTMILRAAQRPKVPAERSEGHVVVPRTTPAVFGLDPRSDPAEARPAEPKTSRDDTAALTDGSTERGVKPRS